MNITILIAHYKTAKMTAYAVAQLLKYAGNHNMEIMIVDNNAGDGSIDSLQPLFNKNITVVDYPKDKMQSEGIGFDYLLPHVKTSHFICLESDAMPTKHGWLDYYDNIIRLGYDMAGSLLKLSGGSYVHPAGAIYSKKLWEECKKYCDSIQYAYFPNMSLKEGFQAHLMVHKTILDEFLKNPEDYIELTDGYKPYTAYKALERLDYYSPTCGPFHHGVGGREESIKTYGDRTMDTETPFAILTDKSRKLLNRIGLEPGQHISYWANAMNKKIFYIPTETKWLEGQENKQQEYTLNEAGVKHIWAISAYHGVESDDPIAKLKQSIPDELYNTLPEEYRI